MTRLCRIAFPFACVAVLLCARGLSAPAPKKWTGGLVAIAQDEAQWRTLLQALLDKELYFTALAAANRMHVMFADLPTKELAYRTMLQLIDMSFPSNIRAGFATADIEPSTDDYFASSYYLYKAIANEKKGMERWAESYFEKVNKTDFPKYLFYLALRQYAGGQLGAAENTLKKLLAKDLPASQARLLEKASRTLARLYYEKEEHSKALDIYSSFLLKLNPIVPSDWLEAAWNLYHLKRYEEALGYLYNLEAISHRSHHLEKFVLRALIYREYCASENIQQLVTSFEATYGELLNGIKSGFPLTSLELLRSVFLEENRRYIDFIHRSRTIAEEASLLSRLPSELRPLADHLQKTELSTLEGWIRLNEEEALGRAAALVITLHENLKFLQYDVVREIYSPDAVFRAPASLEPVITAKGDEKFQIRWRQTGDHWRDERLKYRGLVENRCLK